MSQDRNLLAPPQPGYINPDHIVPLSPPIRPPFAHYHSSSTLPPTPFTPYPPRPSAPAPAAPTTPLKPYLTLPPRLLLTTLTPALLPLILTIAHLIQNRSSTASLAASLKSSVLSACSGLATGAASIQALPRYLAMQTNDEVVRATQASILAVGAAMIDSITIIETVVTFVLDTYRSMLLCTIELAVRGTLDILVGAVELISIGVTSSLNDIRSGIQNDIASANSAIQTAVSAINSVTKLVDVNLAVPQFTIPSLTALQNVTIPTTFESTLVTLNNSLPSLSDLKAKMDSIVDTPFELLKTEINKARLEMAASFNSSILPIPSLTSLAANKANDLSNDLCSGLDTSLIDDTAKALHKLSNVAIGLMFLILFLVWAALCVWEWRRWRAMKSTVEEVEAEWRREGTRDPWRVVAIVEHPVLERHGSAVLERIAPANRTRTNLRWFLAYLSHPTCLALLFIATLGFLSLQFQLVALNAIKSHARENANATVTASTDSLAAKLNTLATGSSQQYANDFNAAIAAYQDRIDNDLFGSWLNTTAVVLNNTLVEFYGDVQEALNVSFGGTILFNPINTFIYCILGSKITNLEQGLTWISQHARITLPTLSHDILLLSNSSMNEIISPITAAAVGSGGRTSDDGVVGSLIDHFESAIWAERNFYAILLGVWLAFALIGIIVMIWHSGGRDRYVARRGTLITADSAAESKFWPWKKERPLYNEYTEKQFRGTTPTVPRIVEPDQNGNSFFDTGTSRPFVPRKSTFGSTISSLAAPGQAFLRMAGRPTPTPTPTPTLTPTPTPTPTPTLTPTPTPTPDHGRANLVEKGASSEQYNSGVPIDELETPPPFWVNKFFRAVGSARDLLPTRGQRHGAALGRDGSQRTERSFRASFTTPGRDWAGEREGEPAWTMVDPQSIGRALDGINDGPVDSRYPPLPRSYPSTSQPIFPRPMSRAPTLHEGHRIPSREVRAPTPPNKHDSIDYLDDESDFDRAYADERYDHVRPSTPSSVAEAHVENVYRPHTGTTALASVLANMQEKRREVGDPFVTPFDDEHRLGGRI